MQRPLLIAILAALTATGPMSIDMYLPALPGIAVDLHGSYGQSELTLSAFFLGFALSQLLYGPLADRIGRRRPLWLGLALFTLGAIGCASAHDFPTLTLSRFAQGMGGGAGPMLARAIIRDLYAGPQVARILSIMGTVMGAAPLMAPIVGGQVLLHADWRAIFWISAGYGIVMLALTAGFVPETLPQQRRLAGPLIGMARGYLSLIRHPGYLSYALGGAFVMGGVFAYLAGSPFVFITLYGVRPEHYGLIFAVNVCGLILMSGINSRLVLRFGVDRMLRLGILLATLAGIALLAVVEGGRGGLAAVVLPLFFYVGSLGFVIANSMAGGLNLFPDRAGAASALIGALQMLAGAGLGALVSRFADGTALPMAGLMALAGVAAFVLHAGLAQLDRRRAMGAVDLQVRDVVN